MKIYNCKTNHVKNPLGYLFENVVFSWIADSEESRKQAQAQVKVSLEETMAHTVFDSGKREDLSNVGFECPLKLAPMTRYYWTVTVWGDSGDFGISEVNWFETGKMDEPWLAQPIRPAWEDKECHPYFRHDFEVTKPVKQARLYIAGQGLFHAEINGKKVGHEYLTPYCTAQDAWIQYLSFDVGELVGTGRNTIGSMNGNGWSKGRFGTFSTLNAPYADHFTLIAELHLVFADGTQKVIGTNEDWLCHPSAIMLSSIYDGEAIDQRKHLAHWSEPMEVSEKWTHAAIDESFDKTKLSERLSLPVIVKETVKPVGMIRTPKGETVLDMGQNMVGWIRCTVAEPEGEEVTLEYGEVLQGGNFYRDNLRRAEAKFSYISDGSARITEPHFTYYGFRYVRLTGFTDPQLEDFTGCVVYSDLEQTGEIITSNQKLNQLFRNTLWSQKGNFLDVPTDCPQRDERMGWTGDAQVFAKTAAYNMDTYAFFRKYLTDLKKEQAFQNGMVGNVVPSFLKEKTDKACPSAGGAAGWGDAATIIPWVLFNQYGEPSVLKEQYASMKNWVEWIGRQVASSEDNHLWDTGFQWGDWLALDGPVAGGTQGGTDETFIATAYYYLSADLLAKTAKILGHDEDCARYSALSAEIRKEILDEYFFANGRSTIPTQTAHVLALQFGIIPEAHSSKTAAGLVELLKKSGWHLTTGFLGTPYLCSVLSQYGYADIAYKVLLQEDYPSWLYAVDMGATTIWERWNSITPDGKISGTGMNSLNHYAYGSIVEWMYEHMCGIRPLEQEPGFSKFVIAPEITGYLKEAEARYLSPKGLIVSGWKRKENDWIELTVQVPFDAVAILEIDNIRGGTLTGIETGKQEGDRLKTELTSGTYTISYQSKESYRRTLSLRSEFSLLQSQESAQVVVAPLVAMINRIPDGMRQQLSGAVALADLLEGLSPSILQAIEAQLDLKKIERQLSQIEV